RRQRAALAPPKEGADSAGPGGAGQWGSLRLRGCASGNARRQPAEPEGPSPPTAGLLALSRHAADLGHRMVCRRRRLPRLGPIRRAGPRSQLGGLEGTLGERHRSANAPGNLSQLADTAAAPSKQTLWRWLDQLVKEGRVLRHGFGSRQVPYKY